MSRKSRDSHRPSRHRSRNATRRNNDFGRFEKLEEKRCLAFVGFFNGVTLDLMQTVDHGDAVVDNNGAGNAIRVTDNSGTLTFVAPTNLSVTMLANTANQLSFRANTAAFPGNVTLNLGNGPRDLLFTGIVNQINGNLTVNGGTSVQNVQFNPAALRDRFVVGGNLTMNLGTGFDSAFNNDLYLLVGGNVSLTGVNLFRYTDNPLFAPDATMQVRGSFTMDTSNENTESFIQEFDTWFEDDDDDIPPNALDSRSFILGNFTYIGGDNIDHVELNHTYIEGNVNINLGRGTPFFGDPQNVTFAVDDPVNILNGRYAEVDGNITITAGDSNLGNVINLAGIMDGASVTYNGGNLVDTVNYTMLGPQVNVTAVMGGGNDTFSFAPFPFHPTIARGVNTLSVDFGNDPGDVFNNDYTSRFGQYSQFDFDADFLNFHFFDHVYTAPDNSLALTQLINTGDVLIDNDGGVDPQGTAWRVFTPLGGPATTTRSGDLVVNLLSNTNNDLEMKLINPNIASITLNVGDGDREVNFTGTSNNPLRDLVINADLGIQNIQLSQNAPLAVASLVLNLGAGFDTVDENGRNVLISEDLVFTGVNSFVSDALLSVTRDAIITSGGDNLDSLFAVNGNTIVGSTFTYTGGDGRDEVRLNNAIGTSIVGNTTIDLGGYTGAGSQFARLNSASTSIGGTLRVNSTGASGTDVFIGHAGLNIGANVLVDLGGGTNNADMLGNTGGMLARYTGGAGVDTVVYGLTGNPVTLIVVLGQGNDSFTLQAGVNIASLDIDFGDNADTFVNNLGPFVFDAQLTGLHGFSHTFTFGTESLVSTQVSDPGPVTVDDNGAGGSIRFINGGTTVIAPVTNLQIGLLDGSGTSLTVDLDSALDGDLTLNLGSGVRALNLTGASNSIGGNLAITGGSDSQTVEIAVNNDLSVGGDATFSLGTGTDSVDEDGRNVTITGNLVLDGVNAFINNGTMSVGGNLSLNNTGESTATTFTDVASLSVGGDFTFLGGTGQDQVRLIGAPLGTFIGGTVLIDLGDNVSAGTQLVSLDAAGTTIGGSLTVRSIGGSLPDSFASHASTSIGGNIDINLGGGFNSATILGDFGGSTVKYNGTSGTDTVVYGLTGNAADVNIKLGAGSDSITVNAGVSISPTLRIDFGGGSDVFVNNFGDYTFNANLLDWEGFDRFYDLASDTLAMVQVLDTGDITVDNNGTSGAIRLIDGAITEMTSATNVRLILSDGSSTNVTVDLDSALAGDLLLQLRSGDRNVELTGASNTVGGLLRIEASDGDQTVDLAVNADLNVGGNLVINGRNGNDVVDEGANGVNVAGALIFRNINSFVLNTTLNVGGDLNFVGLQDASAATFVNNGSFNVTGNVLYLGGSGRDDVRFNAAANVGGFAYFSLGDSSDLTTAQRFRATSRLVTTTLSVVAGTAAAGNSFTTGTTTNLSGNVIVNFVNSTTSNTAIFLGTYGGTYGTIRGGSAADLITFGATASNMFFAGIANAGNDTFALNAGTSLSSLYFDFGAGTDTFQDNVGPGAFPRTIVNLP